jgi:hypothetical protein
VVEILCFRYGVAWMLVFLLFSSILQHQFQFHFCQYPEDSGLYNETYAAGEKILRDEIESNPDVEYILYPEREMIDTNQYYFIEPQNEDYVIGLIIDPVSDPTFRLLVNFIFLSTSFLVS